MVYAFRIKNEEQSNNNSVETKEEREGEALKIDEKKDNDERDERLHQEESSESLFSLSVCSRKKVSDAETVEPEVNSPVQLVLCTREVLEAFGSSPNAPLQKASSVLSPVEEFTHENPPKEKDEEEGEEGKVSHSILQYRYRDCPDEEYDEVNLDTSDLDSTLENEDPQSEKREKGEEGAAFVKRTWVEEESSESLFSLSADSRLRISSAEAENEVDSLVVSGNGANRMTEKEEQDASTVVNRIEKVTKGRVKMDKENMKVVVEDGNIAVSPERTVKLSKQKGRQEIGVETSLSSWLVESESTPVSINSNSCVGEHTPKGRRGSPWSHEDRPILGALTVEEIRMYSLSASSRRSRSRSPDETPIIGTVGSYWTHTQQTMDLQFNTKRKVYMIQNCSYFSLFCTKILVFFFTNLR